MEPTSSQIYCLIFHKRKYYVCNEETPEIYLKKRPDSKKNTYYCKYSCEMCREKKGKIKNGKC
jgi:hypothetical protein